MATVILAAAGAAIGGSVGGGLAGVSAAAIGRLAGATLGRVIDQSVMGNGSDVVETGKVDRFRLTGSAEGAAQTRAFGCVRLPGQVIWATRFLETVSETGGGGKGAPSQPKSRQYSYSVSLAIALCEGQIARVGRIWADGVEVSAEDFTLRVYDGGQDQMPDPKMEAVEGEGAAPAYRGTAYVVFEDLELSRFGNRVPQFSFEVVRSTPSDVPARASDFAETVRAVALMPGTGEYALATSPVYLQDGQGSTRAANENTPSGKSDFATSMDALGDELPRCQATSLVVSWFGDDLRAGHCQLQPKVENTSVDGSNMPWHVTGLERGEAQSVAQLEGRPVYGGTPADASVVEAIRHLNSLGQNVTFYPFILMEQLADNGLNDPWSDAEHQPELPWRGRITLNAAPGRPGTSDGTAAAEAEVAAFFGTATASDFVIGDGTVSYSGAAEWTYRRFILHYAALCAAAGGVEAFCIGSEMRSLTQIRGSDGFPAVDQLIDLTMEVRAILGPDVLIGYAADWSEYFGYHPQDGSGDVYFHLDPLWAHKQIDFIGIDNYMPLSDWRDEIDHLDAAEWADGRNVQYLTKNVAGSEGYDWYYHSEEARRAQIRTPIEDQSYNEPWVFRYKDLSNWWSRPHHQRIGGVRAEEATVWEPMSKPIWFTEIGCAAIDKGANQPNKFLDAKSSESALPYFSKGIRDDLMQQAYYEALRRYWSDPAKNLMSEVYDGRMLDTDRMFAWAWDARPFPTFPNARDLWSDGENYAKGHWINGRATNRTLASVVEEICLTSGVSSYDVSGLYGVVRGYVQSDVTDGRAALQPLMLRHGFDAVERNGVLCFVMRGAHNVTNLDSSLLALSSEVEGDLEFQRASDAELAGRVRLNFTLAERDFEAAAEEAILHDEATHAVAQSDIPEVITRAEGRQTVERWLAESRVARDRMRLALPPSQMNLGAGDVVRVVGSDETGGTFRLEQVTQQSAQVLDAGRVERSVYTPSEMLDDAPRRSGFVPPVPVQSLFLDVPLMTGEEDPYSPHVAVTGHPWPGSVAVYASDTENDYDLDSLLETPAMVGITQTPLLAANVGMLDLGEALSVRMLSGTLQSVSRTEMLNGKNLAFIGNGQSGAWEAFQFQNAELVSQDQYLLSSRLRGQLGTDPAMQYVWPEGSWIVLMSLGVKQLSVPRRARGFARHYRIGPAGRSVSDPSYTEYTEAFSGVGLRPYAPVHLRLASLPNGDMRFSWIRQTRIDGDSWEGIDVPLGEESEAYLVRVINDGSVLREVQTTAPEWVYSQADQQSDGVGAEARLEVSQISAVFGAGSAAVIDF
ncbi:glycoside hydrolase TIM-barrel-like domain-containing protein [Shimia sp. NS0008-38b]|uniref:baseplate multidomain protein megatron n=1 Tax=Shimia sp. NS0008-38b TaxID=3127653 RepID=UPI00310471F9